MWSWALKVSNYSEKLLKTNVISLTTHSAKFAWIETLSRKAGAFGKKGESGGLTVYPRCEVTQLEFYHLPCGPASILRNAGAGELCSWPLYQKQMTVTGASVSIVILAAAKFDMPGLSLKTVNTLSATAMFISRHCTAIIYTEKSCIDVVGIQWRILLY